MVMNKTSRGRKNVGDRIGNSERNRTDGWEKDHGNL